MIQLHNAPGGWSLLRGTQSSWNINGSGFILDKVLKSTAFFKLTSEVDDKNPRHHILMVITSTCACRKCIQSAAVYLHLYVCCVDSLVAIEHPAYTVPTCTCVCSCIHNVGVYMCWVSLLCLGYIIVFSLNECISCFISAGAFPTCVCIVIGGV